MVKLPQFCNVLSCSLLHCLTVLYCGFYCCAPSVFSSLSLSVCCMCVSLCLSSTGTRIQIAATLRYFSSMTGRSAPNEKRTAGTGQLATVVLGAATLLCSSSITTHFLVAQCESPSCFAPACKATHTVRYSLLRLAVSMLHLTFCVHLTGWLLTVS